MARKNYTDLFRRQAVDLYRGTNGATLRGIAADLGISRHTLQARGHALDPEVTSASSEPASKQGRQAKRPGAAEVELAELRDRVAALETENTKIAAERDILRQAAKYFAARRTDEPFPVVADRRHAFEVKRLCAVVEVSRSSFYAWLGAAPGRAARVAADAELAARIRTIHEGDRTQGVPRITAELNDGAPASARVNHKRVARVMRAHALAALRLRRRVRTTIPEPAEQKVPDLLRRDFTAPRAQPALRRRHHVSADRGRVEPVPGHGDRLRLPPPGRVGDRRAHAHRPGHRRAGCGQGYARVADRGELPLRPRSPGSTARRPSPGSAGGSGRPSRWARSVPAPTTRWRSRSTNASLKRETLQCAHAWPDEATCRRAVFGWVNRYNTAQATGGVALRCSRRTVR